MKVRITTRPREPEIDGVRLDGFMVGSVRDVSPSLGTWLVAQGYADLEMRSTVRAHDDLTVPVGLPTLIDDHHRSDD
jgi:hypothetical protein